MYAVTVHIVVKPEFTAQFLEAMLYNAGASRASEPGCQQFDVTVSPDDGNHIFLYEIYDDRAGFDAHCDTSHYKKFIALTAPWLVSKKAQFFHRIDPA